MNIAIQSNQDILFLALAISALAIAFFLCWSLFYLAMSLRDSRAVLKDIRARVERFWEVIDLVHEKLQVGGAMLGIAAKGVKELTEYLREHKPNKGKKDTRYKKQ